MEKAVEPIAAGDFVKEHNRSLENNRDISSWFLTETLVVDFGDSVGRPSSLITLQKEYLTRFLENGWTIDAVMATSETGRWTTLSKTVSRSDTTDSELTKESNIGNTSSSGSTSEYSSTSSAGSTSGNTSTSSSENSSTNSSSDDSSNSRTSSASNTSSSSTSSSSTTSSSNTSSSTSSDSSDSTSSSSSDSDTSSTTNSSQSTQTTTNRAENGTNESSGSRSRDLTEEEDETSTSETDGDIYWAAVQRVRMTRRRMQPELVLQDMINSYVRQHNEGVANEDARYNEIAALYGIWLKRSEGEGNAILANDWDGTGWLAQFYSDLRSSRSLARNAAKAAVTGATDGAEAEIRYEYEALISKTRSQMVGQGTYNGTVWPTVEAGLKRQMAAALAEAKTKSAATAASAMTNEYEAEGDAMAKVMAANDAVAKAIDNRRVTASELRNTAMQAMLNFLASREDVYPQLQEISQLASQIGFTVGAAGNVL